MFCRKRNIVFPLETKSDDEEDDCDDGGTFQPKNSHRRHYRRSGTDDSVSMNVCTSGIDPPPGSLQLSAAADTVTQQNDHHFRFADDLLPVASAHAHCDAACCRDAKAAQPEDSNDANFGVERSEVSNSEASRTDYSVAAASDAAADAAVTSSLLSSSSSSLSSSFSALFSSMSRLHNKRHVIRSLGHVLLNSRWIRRERAPAAAAAGDQSAPSDDACDHVDMTSLLPAL